LGYYETGTAPVLIEALGYPIGLGPDRSADRKNPQPPGATTRTPFDPGNILMGSGPEAGEYQAHQIAAKYFVQIGAFANRSSADLLLARVRYRFPAAVKEKSLSGDHQEIHCVRLKNFTSRQEAERARLELAIGGFPDCLVVLEGFVKKS
jgi:cell division septation protein DedD